MKLNNKIKLVSIVIPAYNEELSIGKTIREIKETIKKIKDYKFEIVVANNNSKDKTEEIAKKGGARVVFEGKQGYGYAYKKGLSEANGDIIITSDADATYPLYDTPKFIEMLENKDYDFIIGNRFALLNRKSMHFLNYIGNLFLTFTTKIIYGGQIKDSQSGMVAFKRDYLNKINLDILSNGMPLCQELKLYAVCLRLRVKSVPIEYRLRIGNSKLRVIKDGVDNLIGLLNFKKRFKRSFEYSQRHK